MFLMQEVFICDNTIALDKLPLEEYEQEWQKSVVKKDPRSREESVSIANFLSKERSKLLFMEKNM